MAVSARRRSGTRWRVHGAWLLVLVGAIVATWFAASAVLSPGDSGSDPDEDVASYVVTRGEVGVTSAVEGELSFPLGPPGLAGSGGVLTSLEVSDATELAAGDVVFSVDLRPVVVAQGEVPAFRDVSSGMSGPDVAQLRQMLGLSEGSSFNSETEAAVREWQEDVGVAADGVVKRGDVLFLAVLPTGAYPQPDIVVGSPISPGQQVIVTVGDVPDVVILPGTNVPVQQGMAAYLSVGDEVLEGVVGPAFDRPDGLRAYSILGADGGPLCDTRCAAIGSVAAPSRVSVDVAIIPSHEGLVVPESALVSLPDGSMALRAVSGEAIEVEVLVQGNGMAVVEGIDEGATIQLFGSGSE